MSDFNALEARVDRIEKAVTTLAWWLVQAQSGLGEQDARGIERIVKGTPASVGPTDE